MVCDVNSAPKDNVLSVVHCGVGIARGEVIEGNVGNKDKLDFTYIGMHSIY